MSSTYQVSSDVSSPDIYYLARAIAVRHPMLLWPVPNSDRERPSPQNTNAPRENTSTQQTQTHAPNGRVLGLLR